MKRFILLFLLTTVLTINAQESNFKEFYKSNKKNAVFSFNVPMFLVRSFVDDQDINRDIMKKATNFKMLVYENNGNVVMNDFNNFSKKNKLKTLLRAKDGKDKVEIYFSEDEGFIKEIILIAGSKEEEVVFMGLKTKKLTKDELASLVANNM